MAEDSHSQAVNPSASRRFLPVVLLLFVGSGCAALIYEIVWFQLLELVIGSSAVSLGVLLGTFMGGMCAGSLALPRVISAQRHPLRVYALLETGIGVLGIAVLIALPYVGRLYVANVGHGLAGFLLRGVVCAMCLLPPTLLMGATLPAIARWVESTRQGISWLGFFYGGNIAGAVFGCLLSGFYLLRVHDMATATYVAATINATVALVGFSLASRTAHGDRGHGEDVRLLPSAATLPVYGAIALSGLSALGAEVIWTRLLSLMLGATVYTFSIILAVFLLGLGIGSSVGAFLARRGVWPRIALGCCQLLLAGAIAWTAYMLNQVLPYWAIDLTPSPSPWRLFRLHLWRCMLAVLPAACLWGASFPLALAAVASRDRDPGRLVGGVYAANTLGAIAGAIAFSMLLIGWGGTQLSQQLLIAVSLVSALLALAPLLPRGQRDAVSRGRFRPSTIWLLGGGGFAGAAGLAALLAWSVPVLPWELVAYGRYLPSWVDASLILYVGEGTNASVAVSVLESGILNFHVSGKVEASSNPQDMRLQRMLGHIPALLHPKPRSVLVVGCGAGVTAGSFVLYPEIERIVICEIEPLIPKVVARYFGSENYDVLRDPRVEVVYDDARHYVLTTRESFDIITCDPIHPWVKGAASLYTKEYFELCKRHLNPGGLVTQWVPLYESSAGAVKSELATFFEVFPSGTFWSNDAEGLGYDTVVLGQTDALRVDVDEPQERLKRADYGRVERSLEEVGFSSALSLLATYAGQGPDLKPWLKGAEINRDRNLRLQYLAGMGLNTYQSERIYEEMLVYRRFPDEIFVGSHPRKQSLRYMIEGPPEVGP